MTSPTATADLELALPAEPIALRAQTRALVERSPAEGAELIDGGEWIAEPLWSHWGAALAAAGMTRARLARVAADYRMELWLWVMGERTWAQCVSGLRGRVLRRLGPGAPPPATAAKAAEPAKAAGAAGAPRR